MSRPPTPRPSRRAPPPPPDFPPDLEAEEGEVDEDGNPVDDEGDRPVFDGFEDAGRTSERTARGDRPVDPGAMRDPTLGRHGWGNAHEARPRRVELVAPMATIDSDQAETWEVERKNPEDGTGEGIGSVAYQCTEAEFINRFMASMPDEGEETAVFYLYALDRAGSRVTTGKAPDVIKRISPEHVTLQRLRPTVDLDGGAFGGLVQPSADSAVIELLKAQLAETSAARQRADERADRERERMEEERKAMLTQREARASSIAADTSDVHAKLHEVARATYTEGQRYTTSAAQELMTMQRTVAEADRQRLIEERREERRDADQRRTDERREADERRADERRREDAAHELKLAMIKAEQAAAAAALETRRLQIEADAKERREAEERRAERDEKRADAMRADAEKRDAERERDRAAAALAITKIQMDAVAAEKERLDAQRKFEMEAFARDREREKEHTMALRAMYEKQQNGGAGASPLGVLGPILTALDWTPATAIEKAKEFLSGGETKGIMATAIESLTELGKTWIEKNAEVEAAQIDADAAQGEEEDEEEPEEQIQRPPKPELRQIAESPQTADDLKPRRKGEAIPITGSAAASAPAQPEATPEPPPPPPRLPLPEQKAGRAAVKALWAALDGKLPADYGPAILAVTAEHPALVDYIGKMGLDGPLRELKIPGAGAGADPEPMPDALIERIAKAMDELTLWDGGVPRLPPAATPEPVAASGAKRGRKA